MLLGHPFIHRMLKEMIKAETVGAQAEGSGENKLKFSATMAKILLKHFDAAVSGRGVFILIELIENKATEQFVSKQLKA